MRHISMSTNYRVVREGAKSIVQEQCSHKKSWSTVTSFSNDVAIQLQMELELEQDDRKDELKSEVSKEEALIKFLHGEHSRLIAARDKVHSTLLVEKDKLRKLKRELDNHG